MEGHHYFVLILAMITLQVSSSKVEQKSLHTIPEKIHNVIDIIHSHKYKPQTQSQYPAGSGYPGFQTNQYQGQIQGQGQIHGQGQIQGQTQTQGSYASSNNYNQNYAQNSGSYQNPNHYQGSNYVAPATGHYQNQGYPSYQGNYNQGGYNHGQSGYYGASGQGGHYLGYLHTNGTGTAGLQGTGSGPTCICQAWNKPLEEEATKPTTTVAWTTTTAGHE